MQFNNPTSVKLKPKKNMKPNNMSTLQVRHSLNRSLWRRGIFLLLLALACFGLSPQILAVVPAPDGGYPGENTAEGQNALLSLTTGTFNTAVGFRSLTSDTDGGFNTAVGAGTLLLDVGDQTTGEGTQNTATGAWALLNNGIGRENTANGAFALFSNTEGSVNTAVGAETLTNNVDGSNNTATGYGALFSNVHGAQNTAVGFASLTSNTTGNSNTAIGDNALLSNSTADGNTAVGSQALYNNTGTVNTAIGYQALTSNTTGGGNIAVGSGAGESINTGSNNIDIGNTGFSDESNTIRIGSSQAKAVMVGIFGMTVGGAAQVYVNSNGLLGTSTSSARFKTNIQDMGATSETLLALRPVTFRYKPELDPEGIAQFGLVAEEVEKVNPNLVVRDKEGKPYTVRYDAVNAMLLNEFLKEHQRVEDLRKDFQATVVQLTAQLREQAAQIQRVSAQLEASKPARQVVALINGSRKRPGRGWRTFPSGCLRFPKTRRIPSRYRALPLGVLRRSHIRRNRHLARSIRDVGSGGRRESVAGAQRLSSTLS